MKLNDFKLVMGLFILGILGGCKSQVQAQPQTNTSFIMRDGIIVDSARKQVFITNPQNKVEAISMTTGETLWANSILGKPLVLDDNRLICQVVSAVSENTIVIHELDVNKNGSSLSSDSLVLPVDIKAVLKQDLNKSFLLKAKIVGNQTYFSWNYRQKPVRGLLEHDSINETSNRLIQQTGALRLNRASRKLNTIELEQLPKGFALNSIIASENQRIASKEGQQFISIDKKFILVSRKVADDGTFDNYVWEIFSLVSKNKIGQLQTHKSYAPFYVTGNTLIYEIGPYTRMVNGNAQQKVLQLVAIDLVSGSQLWSREIFDSIFRGPTPP